MVGMSVMYFCGRPTATVESRVVTDTVYYTKTDTIHDTVPQLVRISVKDTLIVYVKDSIKVELPIEQKHYSKPLSYDVWVSGYQPRLDSVRTYVNTDFRTITVETIKEVENKRIGIYPFVGVNAWNGHIGGKVGVMLTTKGKFAFGGEIGILESKMYYGVNVAYRVN